MHRCAMRVAECIIFLCFCLFAPYANAQSWTETWPACGVFYSYGQYNGPPYQTTNEPCGQLLNNLPYPTFCDSNGLTKQLHGGDQNGDGICDITCFNKTASKRTTIFGTGPPGRWNLPSVLTANYLFCTRAETNGYGARLNGDKIWDNICHQTTDGHVWVWRSTGVNTFQGLDVSANQGFFCEATSPIGLPTGLVLTVGDCNCDGATDLVCTGPGQQVIVKGTYTGNTPFPTFTAAQTCLQNGGNWSCTDSACVIPPAAPQSVWPACNTYWQVQYGGHPWSNTGEPCGQYITDINRFPNYCQVAAGAPLMKQILTGDFDGDGSCDIACFNKTNFHTYFVYGHLSSGYQVSNSEDSPGHNFCTHADEDGYSTNANKDATVDEVCHRTTDGFVWNLMSNGVGTWGAPVAVASFCAQGASGAPTGNVFDVGDCDCDDITDLRCTVSSGQSYFVKGQANNANPFPTLKAVEMCIKSGGTWNCGDTTCGPPSTAPPTTTTTTPEPPTPAPTPAPGVTEPSGSTVCDYSGPNPVCGPPAGLTLLPGRR